MKKPYTKNKAGKVYPSPSSSSTILYCSPTPSRNALSVLKILPAAIIAQASVLSLKDREVLAYMISRSMKTTTSPSLMIEDKKKCKKSNSHKPPLFECGCFDCYTIYWFRWDTSPNRELIHHAIEAFEEHLTNGELSKKSNGRGKKNDRMSRCGVIEKLAADKPGKERIVVLEKAIEKQESRELEPTPASEKADPLPAIASDRAGAEEEEEQEEGEVKCMKMRNMAAGMEAKIQVPARESDRNHKEMARKVLPDVLGLLNSRLWNLWSPSV